MPGRGLATGQVRTEPCKPWHSVARGDTSEAVKGSSPRDKARLAWPEGLPQLCPHHPAPGLWLLCPPCST